GGGRQPALRGERCQRLRDPRARGGTRPGARGTGDPPGPDRRRSRPAGLGAAPGTAVRRGRPGLPARLNTGMAAAPGRVPPARQRGHDPAYSAGSLLPISCTMPGPRRPTLLSPLLALALGGCMMTRSMPERSAFEAFDSSNTYSRSFDHSPAQACEAARRALLSQGFVVARAEPDIVEARKYFQKDESHEQVEFRTVCMPQTRGEHQTVVFVNAVQDRYVLRKSNTSASLGVSALGSVSLPIGSTEDSLVKVASE